MTQLRTTQHRTKQRRVIMASGGLFVIVLAIPSLGGCARSKMMYTSSPTPDAWTGPTRRYLPIEFDVHAIHEAIAERDGCVACHHEVGEATTNRTTEPQSPRACGGCHDASWLDPDAPDRVTATHRTCRSCHARHRETHLESKAPVACLECHTERS